MHRFLAERLDEQRAALKPDEARHARTVLRLRSGEAVQLIMDGQLYAARLDLEEGRTEAVLEAALPSPEPRTRVTLYQGLPKGDKMEYIVQKGTEAGLSGFAAVPMARSVAQLSAKDAGKKAERWQRVALEAAKQSGRARVPEVEVIDFSALVGRLIRHKLVLVPWEEEHAVPLSAALRERPDAEDIALVIGPEGGIAPEEIERLRSCGAQPVTLGRRIFRTETAGLAAGIMILYERGEYGCP